jgi:CHAT domain-containing protein
LAVRTFTFTLSVADNGYAVALTTESGARATSPFQFDLDPQSRLNGVIASMRDGIVTYDQLQDVGANLYKGLINGDVATLFNTVRQQDADTCAGAGDEARFILRLLLPPALGYLPWECLYEEERGFGFLLNGLRYSLVRETTTGQIAPFPQPAGRVRMLAVIPQGSNLSIEKELHGLQLAVTKIESVVEISVLDGRVTPDRLSERLRQGPWDIVHFIGHGAMVDGRARIRLNDENPEADDAWVIDEVFASFFQSVPRLVVLNCCYGGSQAPLRSLSGLGPSLLRAGVPAVVAMQYEIPDAVAIRFAGTFYNELLTGANAGRIDLALASARLSLYQNQRTDRPQSFMTPVLYLVPDHETIVALRRPAQEPRDPHEGDAAPNLNVLEPLPADLLEAFKEQRIVPVIGAELLGIGATRGVAPPPGPRALAQMLAEDLHFRLDAVRNAGEAEAVWLLPEVCQHYERARERFRLLLKVQQLFKPYKPPPALRQVASWNVPGLICAYFDGLAVEALTEASSRAFRSVTVIDEKVPALRADETLVVHLRGLHTESDSLVLTERDEEQLLERMSNLSPHVQDLTRKSVGRSLLFLGVSPRDAVVRRLTRVLRGNGRNQGPMFFVASHGESQNAYWDEYKVRWLTLRLEDFLSELGDAGPH